MPDRIQKIPVGIGIVDFDDRYAAAFRELNLTWIRQWFPVEEEDLRQLENPRGILEAGGEILLAVADELVVGSCALLRRAENECELAKFAVAADHRKTGIGSILLERAIHRARQRGMRRITLMTNSRLTPARRLFERFGFAEIELQDNPYEHADLGMALELGDGPPGPGGRQHLVPPGRPTSD